jgi:hypothetical protein
MKVKVSRQALDLLEEDMDNEELQDFLDKIQKKVDDGSFFEDSEPVDWETMKEEEPEIYEELIKALDEIDNEPKLN